MKLAFTGIAGSLMCSRVVIRTNRIGISSSDKWRYFSSNSDTYSLYRHSFR